MKLSRMNIRYRVLGNVENSFVEAIINKYKKAENYAYQGIPLTFLEFGKEREPVVPVKSEVSIIYRLLLQEVYYRFYNYMVINRNEILVGIEQAIEQHLNFIRRNEPQRFDELYDLYQKIRCVTQEEDLRKVEEQIKERIGISKKVIDGMKEQQLLFLVMHERNNWNELIRNGTREYFIRLIEKNFIEENREIYQYLQENKLLSSKESLLEESQKEILLREDLSKEEEIEKEKVGEQLKNILLEQIQKLSEEDMVQLISKTEHVLERMRNMVNSSTVVLPITSILYGIQEKFFHQFEQIRDMENPIGEEYEIHRQILLSLIQTATKKEEQTFYQYFDRNHLIHVDRETKVYESEETTALVSEKESDQLSEKFDLKNIKYILEETVKNMNENQIRYLVREWKMESSKMKKDRGEYQERQEINKTSLKLKNIQVVAKLDKEAELELLTFWKNNRKRMTSYINKEQSEKTEYIQGLIKYTTETREAILNQSAEEMKVLKESLLTAVEAGESETIDVLYDYLLEQKLIHRQSVERTESQDERAEKQDKREKQRVVQSCLKELLKEDEIYKQSSKKNESQERLETNKVSPEQEKTQVMKVSKLLNHMEALNATKAILTQSAEEWKGLKERLLTAVEAGESETIDVLYDYLLEQKLIHRQSVERTESQDKREKQREVQNYLKELLKGDEIYKQLSKKNKSQEKLETNKVSPEQEKAQVMKLSKLLNHMEALKTTKAILTQSAEEWKGLKERLLTAVEAGESETIDVFYDYLLEQKLIHRQSVERTESQDERAEKQDKREKQRVVQSCLKELLKGDEIYKQSSKKKESQERLETNKVSLEQEKTQVIKVSKLINHMEDLNATKAILTQSAEEMKGLKENLLTAIEAGELEIIDTLYDYLLDRKLIHRKLAEGEEKKETRETSFLQEEKRKKVYNYLKEFFKEESSESEKLVFYWKNRLKTVQADITQKKSMQIEKIRTDIIRNESFQIKTKEIGRKDSIQTQSYKDIRTYKNITVKSAVWEGKKYQFVLERYLKELKKKKLDRTDIEWKQQEKQIEIFLQILEESSQEERDSLYQYMEKNHLLHREKKEILEQIEQKSEGVKSEFRKKALVEWVQSASETVFYKLQEKFMEEYEKQQIVLIEQVQLQMNNRKQNDRKQNDKEFYRKTLLYSMITKYFEALQKLSIQKNDPLHDNESSILKQQKQILLTTISEGSKEEEQILYEYLAENHFIYRKGTRDKSAELETEFLKSDRKENLVEQLRQFDKKEWSKILEQFFIRYQRENYFRKEKMISASGQEKDLMVRDIRITGKKHTARILAKDTAVSISYLLPYREGNLLFRKGLVRQDEVEKRRKEISEIVQYDVTKTTKMAEEYRKRKEDDDKKEYQKQQTELLLIKAELKKQQEKVAEIERYQLKTIKPDEVYHIVMKKMETQLRLERLRRGLS